MNLYFYSPEIVCEQIKLFEDEIKDNIIASFFRRSGNRYVDDALQDVYIKSCEVLTETETTAKKFKESVNEICEDIVWAYINLDKRNPSKPIGELPKNWGDDDGRGSGWGGMGAGYQFALIEDYDGNAERKMIAHETISELKEVKKKWLTFSHAKEYVAHLGLKNKTEWITYCKSGDKIKNIPDNPDEVYKNFINWEDWCGFKYYTYEECCNWVSNNLKVDSVEDYLSNNVNLPRQIPENPEMFYKESGWANWVEFLGIQDKIDGKKYLNYKDAQKWVENNLWELKLNEQTWSNYINKEFDSSPILIQEIPNNPDIIYKQTGWKGWFAWFGADTYNIKKYPISYYACAKWVKENMSLIKTREQWQSFVEGNYPTKLPVNIPPNPHIVFRNRGWFGWHSFLNTQGVNKKYATNLLDRSEIRVKYHNEKIWVKPIRIFKQTMYGTVITVLCSVGVGAEISFELDDIISFKDYGAKRSLSTLKNEFKIAI